MSEKLVEIHTEPIPEVFYSSKSHRPFTECKMCGKALLDVGEPYLIEKAFGINKLTGQKEVVFELAYCMGCLESVQQQISEESKQTITSYFHQHTNMDKRDAELKKYKLFESDIWLSNCVVKNKAMDEVDEYQIYALCQGNTIMYHHAPYMICGEAVDEIMNLMSNKTLDVLNDYMADIIDVPPEYNSLFKSTTPILI